MEWISQLVTGVPGLDGLCWVTRMDKFTVWMDSQEQAKVFSGSSLDFPGKHGQP